MRYPQEITLEVRNEEPDKKRRFTPRLVLKHSLSSRQGFSCYGFATDFSESSCFWCSCISYANL